MSFLSKTFASALLAVALNATFLFAEEDSVDCFPQQAREGHAVIIEEKCEEPLGKVKDNFPSFLKPLSLGPCGEVTFKPGARIQVRYTYDYEFHDNDIFIQRFRIIGSGNAFNLAKYGMELKIDNTGRACADPKAAIENGWLDFPLCSKLAYLRVGLYDLPFSRDALTSDKKLLFMDRSLIKDALTNLGFADNTIGVMLHGRPLSGHLEYDIGIFDNEKFECRASSPVRLTKQLMPAWRIVFNLLDPEKNADGYGDYLASYLCQGKRLAIGTNAAYLGRAKNDRNEFNFNAWGVDLFFNHYCWTLQAEYDWYRGRILSGPGEGIYGSGWYIQGAYLFRSCLELALRYQELEPDKHNLKSKQFWSTIGCNYYLREHNLKVQAEYTCKRKSGIGSDSDLFQIQLQLDF